MKKNYFLTILSLLFCFAIQAQVSYSGNGNAGFGGTVGGSTLNISDDGTTITFSFAKSISDNLDNVVVIYIDSKTGGFNSTSGFDDNSDGLRRAISTTNGGGNDPEVNFPAGFNADFALAFDSNFGGWFTLANGGAHTFGSDGTNGSANLTPTGDNTSGTHTLTIDFSELDITSTDNFKFVATYIADSAFLSDEVYGDGVGAGNPGASGSITFTADRSYPNTWTGATDNSWTDASNWTEGVPLPAHNIHIPAGLTNYPTSSAAVTVNKGTIKSGATLISTASFTGAMTYERSLGTDNWYLMSSPVNGETIEDIITNHTLDTGDIDPTNLGLASFDNGQAVVNDRWDYQKAGSTGALLNGKGYSIKLATAGTVSFTGSLNTGGIAIGLEQGTDTGGNNFTFIGNPYTAFINGDNLLTSETLDLTSETAWFWDQSANAYVTKTPLADPNFKIAPSQGFFVEAANENNLNFSNAPADLTHENTDTFLKTQPRPELFINISNDNQNRKSRILYDAIATTDFDNGYDGKLFDGVNNDFAVYTSLLTNNTGGKFAIQALPNSDLESMVIPVGIIADVGEITFSAEALNLPSGLKVFLEDRNINTFTRLDEANANYKVTLNASVNGIGRFYLHTKSAALSTETIGLENVSMYSTDKATLRIVGLSQGKSTIKMFNVLGKQVLNSIFNSNGVSDINVSQLSTGVYIVQLENEAGSLNKKVVLE